MSVDFGCHGNQSYDLQLICKYNGSTLTCDYNDI